MEEPTWVGLTDYEGRPESFPFPEGFKTDEEIAAEEMMRHEDSDSASDDAQ